MTSKALAREILVPFLPPKGCRNGLLPISKVNQLFKKYIYK